MTLQGIGVSGETVDLDKGTAIFARHVEKDLWNNAYIKQIETKYWDKGLEAVDVHGFNPVQRDSNKSSADTTRATGLQAPRILKLLASSTGPSGSIRQDLKKSFAVTRTVELYDTQRYPVFNVKVTKDEDPAPVC